MIVHICCWLPWWPGKCLVKDKWRRRWQTWPEWTGQHEVCEVLRSFSTAPCWGHSRSSLRSGRWETSAINLVKDGYWVKSAWMWVVRLFTDIKITVKLKQNSWFKKKNNDQIKIKENMENKLFYSTAFLSPSQCPQARKITTWPAYSVSCDPCNLTAIKYFPVFCSSHRTSTELTTPKFWAAKSGWLVQDGH